MAASPATCRGTNCPKRTFLRWVYTINNSIITKEPSAFSAGISRVPGVAWILGLLVIGFALGSSDFLSGANLLNIGLQSVILLMLALPMTLIIMTEGVDISIGALLTLASVVLAWVLALSLIHISEPTRLGM